jgi:hypothetical protein
MPPAIHKSQGATVDRAFVLGGDAMYREAGYVAMSRARERTDLYFTASSFDEAIGRQPESDLARWLSTSRAKRLAVESLQPGRDCGGSRPSKCDARQLAPTRSSHRATSLYATPRWPWRLRWPKGLLGEAAAQRTPGYLAEHLGPVPVRLSERGAWVRLAGAAEALWRRLTGRAPERERQGAQSCLARKRFRLRFSSCWAHTSAPARPGASSAEGCEAPHRRTLTHFPPAKGKSLSWVDPRCEASCESSCGLFTP